MAPNVGAQRRPKGRGACISARGRISVPPVLAPLQATETAVWPGSRIEPYRYRSALKRLLEYEGRRCLWRAAVGGVLLVSAPALAIGGFVVGAYLADGLHDPVRVALAAIVTLSAGQCTALLWRRRLWDALLITRLCSYEAVRTPGDLNAVIRSADLVRASRSLRRAKLYPVGSSRLPEGLPGAPDLDLKLIVSRPRRWHAPDAPETYVLVRDCLRAAGIRARVASEDVNQDA
jgi:hypothetical protein